MANTQGKFPRHYFCGALTALILTLALPFFMNCSVQKPKIANAQFAITGFLHTGQETSCGLCHVAQRPAGLVGSPAAFDHGSASFGGQGDCFLCHKNSIGVSWAGGSFTHAPQPSTCSTCHNAERPTNSVGNPPFNHSQSGQGDCFACHAQSTNQYNTSADWAGGQMMPTGLIGNVALTSVVGTPRFSGVTILSVATATVSLPQQMLHTTSLVSGTLIDTCTNCHSGAASGSYAGAVFHNSIVPAGGVQPTQCLDCHSSGNPVGFIGPAGASRSPASAEMRHEAVAWSTSGAVTAPTTTKIVTQDCVTCHKSAVGTVWSGARFHSALSSASLSQPSSCLDCHANNRPTGNVGTTGFNHANNGGLTDCLACHSAVTSTTNNYSTWVGTGSFNHTGMNSCEACHETQRPSNTMGWVQTTWSNTSTTFNFGTHASSTDCYSCHSSTITAGVFTTMSNWSGGNFPHSPTPASCLGCHTYPTSATAPNITGTGLVYQDHSSYGGQDCVGCHTSSPNFTALTGWGGASSTPSGLVSGTGSAWNLWSMNVTTLNYVAGKSYSTATTSTATVSLPQQMLHSVVPAGTLNSCATCHTAGTTATSGTRYHKSISTQPTTCTPCHNPGGVPSGIVGPVTGSTDPVDMNHAFVYGSGSTVLAAQDCAACHSNAVGTSWNGASFHTNSGSNSIGTCTSCHFVKMPQTLSTSSVTYTPAGGSGYPQHFSHTAASVTSDCSKCHTSMGASNTWVTASKFHTTVTSGVTACAACHASDAPASTTVMPVGMTTDKYLHSSSYSSADCAACHGNQTSSTLWVMTPSSSTAVAAPAANLGVSWAGGVYDHKVGSSKVGSCSGCHSFNSGGSHPRSWGGNISSKKSTYMPCKTCH